MKKIFYSVAACLALVACEDLEKDGAGTIFDNPILSDSPTTPLQPSEQKTKLESVARNFMDECPAEDFQKVAQISEAFEDKYCVEGYDLEPLYEWAEDQTDKIDKDEQSIEKTNGKVEITSTEDIVLLLANHKGHFTFGDKGVTVDTSYNGVKATFTINGKNYEAVIEQSGKVTDAIYTDSYSDSWTGGGYWNESTGEVEYVDDNTLIKQIRNNKFTIGVPESLLVSIKENGSPFAQVNAKFKPSFTSSGVELTKDSFSTEVTFTFEDYEYVITNTKYDGASGKASASESLKKNGKTLISFSISGDVRLENKKWKDENYEYEYVEATLAKDIMAAIDILGEVQIIGACSNGVEASEAIEDFWDALYNDEKPADEKAAQRYLDNFNAKFDFGVFYDRGNNRQADVEFEYIKDTYNPGWDVNGDGRYDNNDIEEYYDLIPIIVFNDESRYSLEEYFTEDAFGKLVEDFYKFCESYGSVFGFSFAEEMEPEYGEVIR